MSETQTVQDTMDIPFDTAPIPRVNKGILVVGGIVVGLSVGFFIAKKRLEAKYRKQADEEIDEIREIYREKTRKLEGAVKVDPKGEKEPLKEVLEKAGYTEDEGLGYTEAEQAAINEAKLRAGEDDIVHNIFRSGDEIRTTSHLEGWDWDVENQIREEAEGDVPYVLHRDEYNSNESGYDQISLTYFEGDDVLCDDHDTPVDDQDAMVGLGNLAKFGHGSGDPKVVFVRNNELELEIEIVHSDDKFSEQRRGIPTDQPPPSDPRHRRSRGD